MLIIIMIIIMIIIVIVIIIILTWQLWCPGRLRQSPCSPHGFSAHCR